MLTTSKKAKILNALKSYRKPITDLIKLIIPTIVGFMLAYITFSKQYYSNEKARLDNEFNKVFDYLFQYPYLVDTNFVIRANRVNYPFVDSLNRYVFYCDYIFDYLQRECEYFNYNKKRIETDLDVADLITYHKIWWNLPEQKNSASYPDKFKKFVNSYIGE